MDKVFAIFGDANHAKLGGGDTFSDQLSCRYTVYIFSMIALLSTTRVFVDEPISCYCPPQFTNSQVDFAKKACWVTNTHYVSYDQVILPMEDDKNKQYISYYQWIPLFLSFQAFLFYLPRLIWKHLSRKSGLTVTHITDASIECTRKTDNDSVEKIMKYIAKNLSKFINEYSKSLKSKNCCQTSWRLLCSNYLIASFLFVKLLYIVNAVGQVFLMNYFLGNNYHMYGFDIIWKMLGGITWTTSTRFPRVAICDFYTRALGNVHRHSVQCVLPMNLFYEIIFIFLWFWIVLLAIVSSLSLFVWLTTSFNLRHQEMYLRRHLHGNDKRQIRLFLLRKLGREGCFLIRLISSSSSDMIAGEILQMLWREHQEQEEVPVGPVPDYNEDAQRLEEEIMRPK